MRTTFRKSNPLYLITDTAAAGLSSIEITGRAIDAGIRTIQLREKNLPKNEVYEIAAAVRKYTKKHNVTFIVNDYIDIACAVCADGVHLGQEDMPVGEARQIVGRGTIIGVSTHSVRQAMKAQEEGADYIGFGPMYHTCTKDTGRPKGIRALMKVRESTTLPIVAIGGITCENIHAVMSAGADAAAIASGILSGNIQKNVNAFMKAVR